MTKVLEGGCLCGAVRYRAEADATLHYLCHCMDCQRWGGAGYHSAIVVAAGTLTVTGQPRVFTRQADSGRTVARYFCGDCGGHLFTSPWPEATRYSVKAGTLDDPGLFRPAHQIWCRSRADWVSLGETENFAEGFTRPVAIGSPAVAPDGDRF